MVPFLLLALRERDWCGDELVRQMPDLGFGAAPPGDVYQALQRMEDEGRVVSGRHELDGGMSRWRYSITQSGEDYLESWADSLERYQEEIDLFFRAYAGKTV
jgi:poly-beta-hydroxybutyrate-responsive repressor